MLVGKWSSPVATAKQLKAVVRARRPAKGPRGKRTRPEPRQYSTRDRVQAAERRIANDYTDHFNRGCAGLKRAQLTLHIIESQLLASY